MVEGSWGTKKRVNLQSLANGFLWAGSAVMGLKNKVIMMIRYHNLGSNATRDLQG